eukprot:IDg15390t1
MRRHAIQRSVKLYSHWSGVFHTVLSRSMEVLTLQDSRLQSRQCLQRGQMRISLFNSSVANVLAAKRRSLRYTRAFADAFELSHHSSGLHKRRGVP